MTNTADTYGRVFLCVLVVVVRVCVFVCICMWDAPLTEDTEYRLNHYWYGLPDGSNRWWWSSFLRWWSWSKLNTTKYIHIGKHTYTSTVALFLHTHNSSKVKQCFSNAIVVVVVLLMVCTCWLQQQQQSKNTLQFIGFNFDTINSRMMNGTKHHISYSFVATAPTHTSRRRVEQTNEQMR